MLVKIKLAITQDNDKWKSNVRIKSGHIFIAILNGLEKLNDFNTSTCIEVKT